MSPENSITHFGSDDQDKKALEFMKLLVANQGRINAFILCMVPLKEDAEDIFQDSLAEMWAKFDTFKRGTNFLAWGTTIAKYKILNYRRKKGHSQRQFSDELLEIIQVESERRIESTGSRMDRLKECVQKLSSRDDKMLRLRYEKDLSFREIAAIYGFSHQAVYRAMGLIHTRLLKCLRRLEAFHEI